jgi:hypothetical protein
MLKKKTKAAQKRTAARCGHPALSPRESQSATTKAFTTSEFSETMNDFALAVITALACVMYAGYTYQTYRERYLRRKQTKLDAKANADDLLRYAMMEIIWVRNEMSNISVSRDDDWDLREHLQSTLTSLYKNLEDYSKTLDNESHN